jgi:RND family efflux transporter MFP subunit
MILNQRRFPWSLLALLLLAGGLLVITGLGPIRATIAAYSARRLAACAAPTVTRIDRGYRVIVVEATYAGASAQVLAEAVAGPIEQQVNGVDDLLQLSSRCTNDGKYTLLLRFKPDVDLNTSQMLVQNRVSVALPGLPAEVRDHGITVKKQSSGVRMFMVLHSPDNKFDSLYLANYATVHLKDELARVPGVGEVSLYGGGDYGMRIWLDPEKLAAHRLTAGDVIRTLRERKALRDPDWLDLLADSVIKSGPSGAVVRLHDIANVELGAGTSHGWARFDGRLVAALGISPTTQARPQQFSAAVRERLARLKKVFPAGLDYTVALDLTSKAGARDAKTPQCLLVEPMLPSRIHAERIEAIINRYAEILSRTKGVQHVLSLSKNPFYRFPVGPCVVAVLSPDTTRAGWTQLTQALRRRFEEVKGAQPRLRALSGPDGLRPAGYPVDLAVRGPEAEAVREFAEELLERLARSGKLTDLSLGPREVLQIAVEIDRTKAARQRVSMQNLYEVLQVALGSADAGEFTRFGQPWKLQVQLAPSDRGLIAGAKRLKIRTGDGRMIPLSSLMAFREVEGPESIDRIDLRPAVHISGNPASGVALGQARWLCETLAEEVRKELQLSPEYALVWLEELSPAKEIPGEVKGGAKPAVPEVAVSRPIERVVSDYESFTGRTAAALSVEIRPRVTGYIADALFKEGTDVKKGDILFRLDPRPYKVDLDQAQANLKLATAERALQEATVTRGRKLVPTGAMSKEELDLALARLNVARAKVLAMEAARERAALLVTYTDITAPISGRVGRRLLDAGNLASADTTLLTTIVSLDPMTVSFDMDERTLLRLRLLARKMEAKSLPEARLPAFVALADEQGFPHESIIDFVDNQVNPDTGVLKARVVFANRDETIKPGMFARVRLAVGSPHKALLVPDAAIHSDLGQKVLYVVDNDNKVVSRRVVVGGLHDGLRVVEQGLRPDDRVVVDGSKRVRPGMTVRPVKAELPAEGLKSGR